MMRAAYARETEHGNLAGAAHPRRVPEAAGAGAAARIRGRQGQAVNALVRRCLWYVENGVRIAVLVDPDDESILVFRRDANPLALRGTDRIDLDEVLPGFESTAQELFESLNAE